MSNSSVDVQISMKIILLGSESFTLYFMKKKTVLNESHLEVCKEQNQM